MIIWRRATRSALNTQKNELFVCSDNLLWFRSLLRFFPQVENKNYKTYNILEFYSANTALLVETKYNLTTEVGIETPLHYDNISIII